MRNMIQIVIGLIFLIVALICPLPTMLAVSGVVWRMIVGLLGLILLVSGSYEVYRIHWRRER